MATIQAKLAEAMTVADLIAELKYLDPDAAVVFGCDYGDHSHTEQALQVQDVEQIDARGLVESAYSNSRMAVKRDGEEYCDCEERSPGECADCPELESCPWAIRDDEDDEPQKVVVLRSSD